MLKEKASEMLASAHLLKTLQMLNYGMDFSKRFKDLMEKRNIKPKELADIIGVDTSQISQWRSGYRNPSRDTLVKLSEALDVKIEDLVSNSDITTLKSIDILRGDDRKLLKIFKSLDVHARREVIKYAEERRKLMSRSIPASEEIRRQKEVAIMEKIKKSKKKTA